MQGALKYSFVHGKKSWFMKQNADPYVRQARAMNLRSRAAFKILQIEDKYHVLPKTGTVLDLGAAPGGWSQVISQRSPQLTFVAIDLVEMEPIPNVDFIRGDATNRRIKQLLLEKYKTFQCIISDMAPKFSDSAFQTHQQIIDLNKDCLNCCLDLGTPSCHLVMKTLQGNYSKIMFQLLHAFFDKVKRFKPKSSKSQSQQQYFVCLNLKRQAVQSIKYHQLLQSDHLRYCKNKIQLQSLIKQYTK